LGAPPPKKNTPPRIRSVRFLGAGGAQVGEGQPLADEIATPAHVSRPSQPASPDSAVPGQEEEA
jgi:hypothetical protein